ncbi:capping protein inhibiting regulator of actin dynamics [Aplysia californica]|uniref:Capping protein inhibiting regulator of actin dynamics n=1 Tax=Aplysia californica TaxID=6500 RepID=A0ABM1A9A5_APLCA|nr:capping protein inhibiting regulator of actin dynamics [Aplysia californica]
MSRFIIGALVLLTLAACIQAYVLNDDDFSVEEQELHSLEKRNAALGSRLAQLIAKMRRSRAREALARQSLNAYHAEIPPKEEEEKTKVEEVQDEEAERPQVDKAKEWPHRGNNQLQQMLLQRLQRRKAAKKREEERKKAEAQAAAEKQAMKTEEEIAEQERLALEEAHRKKLEAANKQNQERLNRHRTY